jgi:hypothetical protein
MDIALILLIAIAAWQVLRVQYQRTHIALLGNYLASLQLERHMETLTNGYTRAIHEKEETRQTQVLETFAQAERTMAAQVQSLADAMRKESSQAASMGTLPFCLPYIELFLPALTRDFRELLRIHAAGLRHVVDNEGGWDMKSRAYHLSAELYLLQHRCSIRSTTRRCWNRYPTQPARLICDGCGAAARLILEVAAGLDSPRPAAAVDATASCMADCQVTADRPRPSGVISLSLNRNET